MGECKHIYTKTPEIAETKILTEHPQKVYFLLPSATDLTHVEITHHITLSSCPDPIKIAEHSSVTLGPVAYHSETQTMNEGMVWVDSQLIMLRVSIHLPSRLPGLAAAAALEHKPQGPAPGRGPHRLHGLPDRHRGAERGDGLRDPDF